MRVKRGYKIGSDHFLLEAIVKRKGDQAHRATKSNDKKVKIIIHKLGNIETFQRSLTDKLKNKQVEGDINYKWIFLKALIRAASKICGCNRICNNKNRTH